MDLIDMLASNNYIFYNKQIAVMYGVEEAILLGAMCSYQRSFENQEFYREEDEIVNDTGLTLYAIRKAKRTLQDAGILEITKKGLPAKHFIKVIPTALLNATTSSCENDTTSGAENITTSGHENCTTNNNNKYNNKKKENIIKERKKDIEKNTDKELLNNFILEAFEKIWLYYPRKVSKERSKQTWIKKLSNMDNIDDIKTKANKIYIILKQQIIAWSNEINQDGHKGRYKQFIPHFSTWLNSEIPN